MGDSSQDSVRLNPLPDLRQVLGRFATGVVVVTARTGNEHLAVTMNSFSSVSLDPPLISICLGKHLRCGPALETAPHFCISILGAGQRAISQRFAKAGDKAWEDVPYRTTELGIRVIEPSVAVLECRRHIAVKAGDHSILLGELTLARLGDLPDPLLFFGSQYATLNAASCSL
ncbi:flavin reductase family protein [Bosea sp. TND4EK4]|uniref:flavin reductase family protein n=1 Tax=Bosea sp. TND4EK4 TaxID=1907408 RepID=UPI0009548729|nr:flavin reductase family protein [Bosea sp. TND4EK4]SIR45988.1 NADH-FMN oxidoreductase RutF, flavin reductase (DIM6/NTAB) family [Bosea sp. TND4EK4]